MKIPLNLVVLALLMSLAPALSAQTPDISGDAGRLAATNLTVNTSYPAANQLVNSLSSLPDADMLVFINPQRILNEVVPKIMPPKDVEGMRMGFEEARKSVGVDPTKVDYIVVAIRFRKPTAELNFQAPEALIVAGGDFSAESLFGLARMVSQGQMRDEKYGDKTLGLMKIDPIAKEAEKNPLLRSFSELGIASLNANTIAAGSPAYLRAAIDAGDGKERITVETLNSLVRDPNALISVAGRPWHSFAKSFGMLGTETTARAPRCDSKIGDFYAALTMDATNFMLRGAMNEDNPDTAKILSNLFSGLLGYAGDSIKDPSAQSLLKNLTLAAEGDEVLLSADFPQQVVVNLIQQQMKPKPAPAATATPAVKPPAKRRRTKRRG